MRSWVLFLALGLPVPLGFASTDTKVPPQFYRELTLKLRPSGQFLVPIPGSQDVQFSYAFQWAEPLWAEPKITDTLVDSGGSQAKGFYRAFYDKVFLQDTSAVLINGETLPLTCIYVRGQDNRYAKGSNSPIFPDFIMKVYVVANDYSCQGPIRPGWPGSGGEKEAWKTYVYFEVTDPTIMLPQEAHLKYRGNEYEAVLLDPGATP